MGDTVTDRGTDPPSFGLRKSFSRSGLASFRPILPGTLIYSGNPLADSGLASPPIEQVRTQVRQLHQTCYFETLSPMNGPLATCRGSASCRGLLVRVCAAWGVAAGDAGRDEVAVLGAVWGGFALGLSDSSGL